MQDIRIKEEPITLGQFLKLADCISSGGHAKAFLQDTEVSVNGDPENRRGRKLYNGDKVVVMGCGTFQVVKA